MEKIEQYDVVLLKDGQIGTAVEIYGDQDLFDVDVGSSTKDWDNFTVKREDIVRVIHDRKEIARLKQKYLREH